MEKQRGNLLNNLSDTPFRKQRNRQRHMLKGKLKKVLVHT